MIAYLRRRVTALAQGMALPGHENNEQGGVVRHRAWLARVLVLSGLGIGFLLIVPSLLYAFTHRISPLIAAELVVYVLLACIAVFDGAERRLHSLAVVGLCMGFGLFLFAYRGPAGAGQSWLGASVVLATLLFGFGGGLLNSLFVLVSLAFVAWAAARGLLPWSMAAGTLHLLILNIVCLALLTSLAGAALVRSLRLALGASERLRADLAERGAALEREAAERLSAEEKAVFYRDYDEGSGLPNREFFMRELSRSLASAGRRDRLLALLAVGTDRMGRVYDEFGQEAGAEALRGAAGALKAAFREDDLVARFRDDLFFVLCADVKSVVDANGLVAKARAAFERPFQTKGGPIGLTANLGISLYPHDGRDAEELARTAAAALRLAEGDGPGSYRFYDASIHGGLVARLRYERDLEAAIREERLEPWFQPKVDKLGRIVGAEALARWPLEDGSLRLPGEFVPVSERAGFVDRLGALVLKKACEAIAAWDAAGLRAVPIAVNLSPFQLRRPALAEELRDIIAAGGVDPSRLELEITESGMAGVEDGAACMLRELRGLGLRLAIDDFGTGASGIARLKDYPVDVIKLPKEFVDPLPGDQRAATVARAIIELSHELDYRVVAEGVESRSQFDWLRGARCDSFQGYLFAPPLAADDFGCALASGFAPIVD
ncbi:MAG: bifunctional diguanylate cyclase/phosphodiesterase [Spirochaetaceae bacterium]|nr:bifunctional diguanylate cyclase/phosphodiesterase [Spirochaetaceae bacterium]